MWWRMTKAVLTLFHRGSPSTSRPPPSGGRRLSVEEARVPLAQTISAVLGYFSRFRKGRSSTCITMFSLQQQQHSIPRKVETMAWALLLFPPIAGPIFASNVLSGSSRCSLRRPTMEKENIRQVWVQNECNFVASQSPRPQD